MLDPYELELIKDALIVDEELRLFPYVDCCKKTWKKCQCLDDNKGSLTIGVGRNLDSYGITESEAYILLDNNIQASIIQVERAYGTWFKKLNPPRKVVIVSMAFNMGIDGLGQFHRMIKCILSGDFSSAANQMLNSKWASQVGKRAVRLAKTMRTGEINQ